MARNGAAVAGCFRDKNILITGSTGFIGKMLAEKILRVQPDVKKLYLLVRAPDAATAQQRVSTEVIPANSFLATVLVVGKDLFNVLREKHGAGFNTFIEEKLVPIAGDALDKHFGLESSLVRELSEKVDAIFNVAATTKFYERYDIALTSNVLGVKHVCEFAKDCPNLKMLLHVSTAYVAGEQGGLLLERPFQNGETLKSGTFLDIEAEFQMVDKIKMELAHDHGRLDDQLEKTSMKELGMNRAMHFGWPNSYVFTKAMGEMLLGQLRGDLPVVIVRPTIVTSIIHDPLPGWIEGTRTIDVVIVAYGKQALSCFIGGDNVVIDVIPGDMVVNAMMVAMVAHWNQHAQTVYHVSSSLRNPLCFSRLTALSYRYFSANPQLGNNGKAIKYKRLFLFNKYAYFFVYMFLMYELPLEMLNMVSLLFGGLFSQVYYRHKRNYRFAMLMAKLYAPYCFFKGRFDDSNVEKLRAAMRANNNVNLFDFDPRSIDWDMYFNNIHIPGLLKYGKKNKIEAYVCNKNKFL